MDGFDVRKIEESLRQHPGLNISYLKNGSVLRSSYAELLSDIRVAKKTLVNFGVRRGMRVGIMAENDYVWVVADLALISLGCISVAFPSGYFVNTPWDELATRFGIQLALTDRETGCAGLPGWVVSLKELLVASKEGNDVPHGVLPAAHATEALPADTFALAFSSGTSGKLKCLKIGYSGLNAFLKACAGHIDVSPKDLLLVFLPLSGFPQRELIYASILYGMNLAIVRPMQVIGALRLLEPTLIASPPALFEIFEEQFRRLMRSEPGLRDGLISSKSNLRIRLGLGSRLRLALTCAAPCRASTLTTFEELGIPLLQCYGLTETGYLTCNWPSANRPGTVGKELFPGSLRIAEDGELLYCSKDPVAAGYFACEPDIEKKTFLHGNIIATGDFVTIDDDGFYRIMGRKKNIIVTQFGDKVQPEELENALTAHWAVKAAVVLGGATLPLIQAVVSIGDDDSPAVRAEIASYVRRINRTRPSSCGIQRTIFTKELFTVENGLLNRAEKVDRVKVHERYRAELMSSPATGVIHR